MQHGLLWACSRTGSEGGTRVQHGLLCACSRTGSEGGVECSTGCSVPVVVQGVRERVQNPLEHDLNSLTLPPAAYVRIYLAGN